MRHNSNDRTEAARRTNAEYVVRQANNKYAGISNRAVPGAEVKELIDRAVNAELELFNTKSALAVEIENHKGARLAVRTAENELRANIQHIDYLESEAAKHFEAIKILDDCIDRLTLQLTMKGI